MIEETYRPIKYDLQEINGSTGIVCEEGFDLHEEIKRIQESITHMRSNLLVHGNVPIASINGTRIYVGNPNEDNFARFQRGITDKTVVRIVANMSGGDFEVVDHAGRNIISRLNGNSHNGYTPFDKFREKNYFAVLEVNLNRSTASDPSGNGQYSSQLTIDGKLYRNVNLNNEKDAERYVVLVCGTLSRELHSSKMFETVMIELNNHVAAENMRDILASQSAYGLAIEPLVTALQRENSSIDLSEERINEETKTVIAQRQPS